MTSLIVIQLILALFLVLLVLLQGSDNEGLRDLLTKVEDISMQPR